MSEQPANPRRTWPIKAGCGTMVLLVLVAVALTVAIPFVRGRRRMQARMQLEKSGAAVIYVYQFTDAPPRSQWSMLAEERLGMDVEPVVHVGSPKEGWTSREIAQLSHFPEVKGIDLGSSELTGPLLEELQQLKELRGLLLWERPATRQTMANLRYFPELENLTLSAELDDETWLAVAGLAELRVLSLVKCRVLAPAPDWFRSRGCRIEEVTLHGDQRNDSVLSQLRDWPSLRYLRVNHITLDDAAVQAINSLPELELLELHESKVPANFSPPALTGPQLKNLTVTSSEVHEEALKRCSSWNGALKIDLSYNTAVE